MSKNYLDIAANGNLVKKSIEELCFAISQNPEENSGKYFRLRYDTENEHTNELDRVSIVLEAIKPEMPKINGELGQILINDGNNDNLTKAYKINVGNKLIMVGENLKSIYIKLENSENNSTISDKQNSINELIKGLI